MNQNNRYDTAYIIPALSRHLFNNSREGRKEEAYTEKEKRLCKILSQTKGQTLIAISIRHRLSNGSLGSFREMIAELKDQYRDCGRERMIDVLGIDAVRLLEVL